MALEGEGLVVDVGDTMVGWVGALGGWAFAVVELGGRELDGDVADGVEEEEEEGVGGGGGHCDEEKVEHATHPRVRARVRRRMVRREGRRGDRDRDRGLRLDGRVCFEYLSSSSMATRET